MKGSSFDKTFSEAFASLNQSVRQQYEKSIRVYEEHIIPFEIKRMKDNRTLFFEKDKQELMSKIEQLVSQNKGNEYVMENQQKRIHELERKIQQLEAVNHDHLTMIQSLNLVNLDQEASLNEKVKIIKQVQEDKDQVLADIEKKNQEFNYLLAAYQREANNKAERQNEMNEMEENLRKKDKELKEQEFYLKKQWEQFENAKHASSQPQPSSIPNRPFRQASFRESSEDPRKSFSERAEILSSLKKIYKHHSSEIYDVSFNYNGSIMATCGGDRLIKIYDVLGLKSGVTISSNSADSVFISVSLDYSGERLLAGSTDNMVQIYSATSGKQIHSFVGHGYKVNGVAWSCSKQKCVSGSDDKQIKVWEIEKAANLASISSGRAVKTVVCNSVEPIVYSGHSDGSVRLYSLTQGSTPISQVKGIIDYQINSISLMSNRHQALVSSQQGSVIHIIDFKMNKSIMKFEVEGFFNSNVKADISPSQAYVVAGSCDGYLYYWNRAKGTFQKRVSGHDTQVTTLKYQFLSGVMASCEKQGSIILWQ